jgi:hypothetical protein
MARYKIWINNWIYWTLITCTSNYSTQSRGNYSTFQVFPACWVFTWRCLVMDGFSVVCLFSNSSSIVACWFIVSDICIGCCRNMFRLLLPSNALPQLSYHIQKRMYSSVCIFEIRLLILYFHRRPPLMLILLLGLCCSWTWAALLMFKRYMLNRFSWSPPLFSLALMMELVCMRQHNFLF